MPSFASVFFLGLYEPEIAAVGRLCRQEFVKETSISVHQFFFVSVFRSRVSICNSPDCPELALVDQASLELTEIFLPLPPECWD